MTAYADDLHVAFIALKEAVPDLGRMAGYTVEALDQLAADVASARKRKKKASDGGRQRLAGDQPAGRPSIAAAAVSIWQAVVRISASSRRAGHEQNDARQIVGGDPAMLGTMMDTPLLITEIMRFGERNFPHGEIVSVTLDNPRHRTSYGEVFRRARKLANALTAAGLKPGDRVATLAWNDYRHLELYYAVSCMGAVLHTVNPRLFPEQLESSSTTPRTGCSSSTRHCCLCSRRCRASYRPSSEWS